MQATVAAGGCGTGSPASHETVDDLLILANLEPDRRTGHRARRRRTLPHPRAGLAAHRRPDALRYRRPRRLSRRTTCSGRVILHEMGHVLGFGTLWSPLDLLEDAHLSGGPDPHFTGPLAIAAFDAAGGAPTPEHKVPVEDTDDRPGHGGQPLAGIGLRQGAHDRLRGPRYQPAQRGSPCSRSHDQGYTVNLGGADAYTLSTGLRIGIRPRPPRHPAPRRHRTGPIYAVDETAPSSARCGR